MSDERKPAPKPRSGLLVRLPLLLAIGLGLWLWKGGGGMLIAERTIVFRMPADRADLSRFEFQLYEGEALLKRAEHRFDQTGAPPDLSTTVQLKEGRYALKLLRWYGETPKASQSELSVTDEARLVVDVPPR